MALGIAFRAFFRALRHPAKARNWLEGRQESGVKGDSTSHLLLLSLLQQSGRLVDFLKEDITQYNDAQVGAAVRQLHRGCAEKLDEWVAIRPLSEVEEGKRITVPKEYSASEYRLVGKVSGEGPFEGVVRHTGWKAHKLSLPERRGEWRRDVIAPIEVEV